MYKCTSNTTSIISIKTDAHGPNVVNASAATHVTSTPLLIPRGNTEENLALHCLVFHLAFAKKDRHFRRISRRKNVEEGGMKIKMEIKIKLVMQLKRQET